MTPTDKFIKEVFDAKMTINLSQLQYERLMAMVEKTDLTKSIIVRMGVDLILREYEESLSSGGVA